MWAVVGCIALRKARCLELRYGGFTRLVEVHAVGTTDEGHQVMRVWQVSGGSAGGEHQGWKLLRIDEIAAAKVTALPAQAPRIGYNPDDPAMTTVHCRV